MLKKEKENAIKEPKSLATRKCSEMTLNVLTKQKNNLIGGAADLAGSNNTKTKNHKIIKPGDFTGDYIHYGVREHAMSGVMNGIALHSNLIPYGGTFLIFCSIFFLKFHLFGQFFSIHLKFYLGYQKVWFSNLRLFLQA